MVFSGSLVDLEKCEDKMLEGFTVARGQFIEFVCPLGAFLYHPTRLVASPSH